jgi:adenine-specific DNA-methyltransferase
LVFTKKDDGWTVDYKQYLKDEDGKVRGSKLYSVLDGPFTVMEGPYTQAGTAEIEELFGNGKVFPFPKPSSLIKHLIQCSATDAIALDFFAGSGSSAHAVMALNAEDGGHRKFILVQLPEKCDENSDAFKAGFHTIADITKERIRRAGKKLKEMAGLNGDKLDTGFRVLKVDASNMKDVYYQPDAVSQATLHGQVDNVKEDRSDEDLLFQVLLDWGVDLTLPIKEENIKGKKVHFVDSNALAACFEPGVDESFIKELAKRKPLRAVFRDTGYGSDATKINVEQIFKHVSPGTEVKSI